MDVAVVDVDVTLPDMDITSIRRARKVQVMSYVTASRILVLATGRCDANNLSISSYHDPAIVHPERIATAGS
ncbi:hypothetical protein IQ268_24345 [Oculatella sp. LEGE 06141]|uniref:hypothetical protein n=1 Tax=Oculatella sp. LEGE 06141 TaxID=1828648 RepID=UPI001880D6AE|nr:hypothetical protein [Oculatella sp. LEGE 06141]MBE9181700.1 hypothetical protein [Oculatella sp. LEGE 06141]